MRGETLLQGCAGLLVVQSSKEQELRQSYGSFLMNQQISFHLCRSHPSHEMMQ